MPKGSLCLPTVVNLSSFRRRSSHDLSNIIFSIFFPAGCSRIRIKRGANQTEQLQLRQRPSKFLFRVIQSNQIEQNALFPGKPGPDFGDGGRLCWASIPKLPGTVLPPTSGSAPLPSSPVPVRLRCSTRHQLPYSVLRDDHFHHYH